MDSPAGRFSIPRQDRPRRPPFMLTPLIDVMFLLLIFFMLSSQLAPYSLLPIGRIAGEAEGGAAVAAAPDLSVRVAAGFVGIGGESVAVAELAPAFERFVAQGVTGFLVIPTRSASVQDIVTTLEALQAAGAERVTLVNAAGGAP